MQPHLDRSIADPGIQGVTNDATEKYYDDNDGVAWTTNEMAFIPTLYKCSLRNTETRSA